MEEHGRKFLERQRRKCRVLFTDKILIKPMSGDTAGLDEAESVLMGKRTLAPLESKYVRGKPALHLED